MGCHRTFVALSIVTSCLLWNLLAQAIRTIMKPREGLFPDVDLWGFLAGGGMYSLSVNNSGGYNLHIPILSLPGRAGHDLNIYARMAASSSGWRKATSTITTSGPSFPASFPQLLARPPSGALVLTSGPP